MPSVAVGVEGNDRRRHRFGIGSTTKPLTPSMTNSSVPPESRADHRLSRQKRFSVASP